MCSANEITKTAYKWETKSGASAKEFTSQESAESWMVSKIFEGVALQHYNSLSLVRTTKTTVKTTVHKAVKPY